MKTKHTQTSRELGFIGQTTPMSPDFTKLFMTALMADAEEIEGMLEAEPIFAVQILEKRIEAMELPIQFSATGKLAAVVLTEGNPGRMMLLLIECLTKYQNKTITTDELVDMFPMGFYNESSCIDLIDNYMKPKKVAWSEVY